MNDFAEAQTVFAESATNTVLAFISGGGGSGTKREIPLNGEQYREANQILYLSPIHGAIRRYITESVLNTPIEFRTNKSLVADEFLRQRWILEQTPHIMSEIWTLGLVAVRLQLDPDTDWIIPYVHTLGLGISYKITVQEKKQQKGVKYVFYKINHDVGSFSGPKRDRKTIIYNGFDVDPDQYNGSLRSIVASLVEEEYQYRENYRIARIALMNMARPMVLLETSSTTEGIGSNRGDESSGYAYLGGQDFLREEQRRRVQLEATSLDVNGRLHQAYWDSYMDRLEEMANSANRSVHQAHNNIVPLPHDSKSANYQHASTRSGWRDLTDIHVNTVAWAYGLQHAHLESNIGRLQVSETLTNVAITNVINRWRDDLSRIFTDMYRKAFNDPTGMIVFPHKLNDTAEGLFQKWDTGLLSWEGYKTLIGNVTGIESQYMNPKEPPRTYQIEQQKQQQKQKK